MVHKLWLKAIVHSVGAPPGWFFLGGALRDGHPYLQNHAQPLKSYYQQHSIQPR